jgi:hypothetical protein
MRYQQPRHYRNGAPLPPNANRKRPMQDSPMKDSLRAGVAGAPTYTGHNRNEENGGAMPILTDEIKEFIVRGLASFETAAEVAEAVKSTFGVEISRRHVYAYDPKCPQPPAPRWRDLHAAARAAYLSELAEIGVAHKAFRLRALDRMVRDAMKYHYPARAQALLEQAARETRGLFDPKPSA